MGDMSEYYSYDESNRVPDDVIEDAAKQDRWTMGDGSRIVVCSMTDAHLFFALAKSHRNEYPDARSKASGRKALEKEALKRLLKADGKVGYVRPNCEGFEVLREAYALLDAATYDNSRLVEELKDARAKNTKLSKLVDKYQQTRAGLGLPPAAIE